MDERPLSGSVFLPDAFRTNPIEPLDFQLFAHGSGDADAIAVEPVFAFVATNHEAIIVRRSTNAPQLVGVVFIFVLGFFPTVIVQIVIIVLFF